MVLLCGSSVDIASPYSQVSLVPMVAATPGTWRHWSTRAHWVRPLKCPHPRRRVSLRGRGASTPPPDLLTRRCSCSSYPQTSCDHATQIMGRHCSINARCCLCLCEHYIIHCWYLKIYLMWPTAGIYFLSVCNPWWCVEVIKIPWYSIILLPLITPLPRPQQLWQITCVACCHLLSTQHQHTQYNNTIIWTPANLNTQAQGTPTTNYCWWKYQCYYWLFCDVLKQLYCIHYLASNC